MPARPRRSTVARATAALALACALVGHAPAQQDSADATVGIEKVDRVQITKVDDILIGVFPSNAEIDSRQYREDQFDYQCVHSTTGGYSLQITSANVGGGERFELVSLTSDPADAQGLPAARKDAEGNPAMRYEVHLWYRPIGGSFQYVSTRYPRAPIELDGLSASLSPTCADEGLGNSNLIVTALVLQNDFNRAPPGIYRDLLTITVRPE